LPFCRCHCRSCGGHFTSLAAFDAHRPKNSGLCEWPSDAPLTERTGNCNITSETFTGISLYEHKKAQDARDYFRSDEGAQALSGKRKTGVVG
jgi:hypothetical protein